MIETILQSLQDNKISENEVQEIMEEIIICKDVKKAVEREKVENLEEEVLKIIKEKPGSQAGNSPARRIGGSVHQYRSSSSASLRRV